MGLFSEERPGVDVMISIFSISANFRWKKTRRFFTNQCNDQIFAKSSYSLNKNAYFFAKFCAKNILKS
jgi:hypothetical protein